MLLFHSPGRAPTNVQYRTPGLQAGSTINSNPTNHSRAKRSWNYLVTVFLLSSAPLPGREPLHPILTISGSGSGAGTILSTWPEDQYTNYFVPHQSPRNDSYGFVPAVISGDSGWSWSASNPNQ